MSTQPFIAVEIAQSADVDIVHDRCPRDRGGCDGQHSLAQSCRYDGKPALCAACEKPCDLNCIVDGNAYHWACMRIR